VTLEQAMEERDLLLARGEEQSEPLHQHGTALLLYEAQQIAEPLLVALWKAAAEQQ
jgi:hypothetical protein